MHLKLQHQDEIIDLLSLSLSKEKKKLVDLDIKFKETIELMDTKVLAVQLRYEEDFKALSHFQSDNIKLTHPEMHRERS